MGRCMGKNARIHWVCRRFCCSELSSNSDPNWTPDHARGDPLRSRTATHHRNSVQELESKRTSLPELSLASYLGADRRSQGLTDVASETRALGRRHRAGFDPLES